MRGLQLAGFDTFQELQFFFTCDEEIGSPTGRRYYEPVVKQADAALVLDAPTDELDIEVGEVTEDKKYSLEAVRCLGACGLAPVMVVGQDTYGGVEATKVMDIIKKYE